MGLDKTGHDLHALAFLLACGFEHGIGLAHARCGAEEDLELPFAFPLFLLSDALQQLIGVRPSFVHGSDAPCALHDSHQRAIH